jgi:CheY-like chemotaxis protein
MPAPPPPLFSQQVRDALAHLHASADCEDASSASAELPQVVRGVLGTLKKLGTSGERAVRARVSVPDTLPPVAVEPDLLRQALLNLLLYVARATPPARAVISAAESPRGVVLRLGLENGRGEPLDIPVPASASTDARALLDSGQRVLGMLGVGLDVGPELTIALPVAGGYKLLVVDDNPDVGGLFRRYLRGAGYRVLQATSGAAALTMAIEFRPHVVLLDVLLPTRDGWEIMSDLRATPGLADTPVVICSVLPEEAMARSLQAADFLPKPVTRAALLALLARWRPPSERTAPPGHW